ncbi:M14 family metallopeptidase [Butyrivibrio sp. DSM 10294]|uniref:M14 family metallopeptidase n=1 Tax=Butyrivibrio sp. DSM 10294 TaxID=2972457 RepID=UPI00234EEEFB|nr:M14 family metallopeptidase [Butyrivibrio sp. DSM 10294]MDC7293339.1 M14 family metallopeptidase [Butyrivibrio sp. DSM 10294]
MKKRTIYEINGLYRDSFRITGYEFGKGKKSLCIVGSMRGNEVQQLYCCSQLVKKFKQLEEERRITPGIKILIIPCCNPYSMNIQKRFWTIDNTDINRMFPGYALGETTQRIADGIFSRIKDYEHGIQFTSFYMPGEFMPHVRMMDEGFSDVDTAMKFGLPYVVKRAVRPYDTATLNYNWQVWNTKAYSLYTSTTSRIDKKSAGQAVLSVLRFCAGLGLVKYRESGEHPSVIISDKELISVRTAKSGIFEPLAMVGEHILEGTPLAEIIDPYDGTVMETLYAPCEGNLFFMHSDPITYADTAVIKMVRQ